MRDNENLVLLNFWSESMYVPKNLLCMQIMAEVFIYEWYRKLNNCDIVLDIWWYIWESAIYLSKINNKVITYEPNKKLFSILEKNCKWRENIIFFNKFVWVDNNSRYMKTNSNFDSWWSVSIDGIMRRYSVDGLKMDIEWWEFEILEWLMKTSLFPFKKWIIEFHFIDPNVKEKILLFNNFIDYLTVNNYSFLCYDNYGKVIDVQKVIIEKTELCNLYFKQKHENS